MKNRRVIVLVTIALILTITAITLNTMDSDVPTAKQESPLTGAVVGIDIQPSPVEDRLAEEGLQS